MAIYCDLITRFRGRSQEQLPATAISDRSSGRARSETFVRYLGTGKVHMTRHMAAVNLSHQKGVTLEQVRQFLGHKHARTTSDYLREKWMDELPDAAGLSQAASHQQRGHQVVDELARCMALNQEEEQRSW